MEPWHQYIVPSSLFNSPDGGLAKIQEIPEWHYGKVFCDKPTLEEYHPGDLDEKLCPFHWKINKEKRKEQARKERHEKHQHIKEKIRSLFH